MPKASLGDHHLEWFRLLTEVKARAAELPFVLDLVGELERLMAVSSSLDTERAALIARAQQLTRDQDAVLIRARIVAGQIRAGIRTKYGYGSEALIGFGMRPRRRKAARMEEERDGAALAVPVTPDPSKDTVAGNRQPKGGRSPSKGRRRPS